jgi:hypothetical protein
MLSISEKCFFREEPYGENGADMNSSSLNTVTSYEDAKSVLDLKVADAVWVATALLHKKYPERDGFTTDEIVSFVMWEHLTKGAQKSIWQHVNQHCVANRKPQPNRVRMLFAIGGGDRRLFRNGDRSDPGRENAPTHPKWEELPTQYQYLKRWYEEEWNGSIADTIVDPLFALIGTWKDEPADEYVAKLRSDWSDR